MKDNLQKLLTSIDSRLAGKATNAADPGDDGLVKALRERFGFEQFKPHQRPIVEAILDGKNVLAVLPTGYGKSLCYQLPALVQPGLTVVVSPLISLMKDQVDQLRAKGIAEVAFINSSLAVPGQRKELARAVRGEAKLLYVAPERFRSRAFTEELAHCQVSLFVIDEAHCISQWGHDFRPDYLTLKETRRLLQPKATALFTASATPEVEADMIAQLGLADIEKFTASIVRTNLNYRVVKVTSEKEKFQALAGLLQKREGKGIVYVARRREAEDVAAFLQKLPDVRGADFYHAGRTNTERKRVQEAFFDDGSHGMNFIAATSAFGLGIDKRNIRFVIHFTMPGSLEAYYQEAGRAGRDGLPSDCILLYWKEDLGLQKWFIKKSLLSKRDLLRVYRGVEACSGSGRFRWVNLRDLEWETGADNTTIRVGLSLLQRLGLIKQHPNIARELMVQLTTNPAIKTPLSSELRKLEGVLQTLRYCRENDTSPLDLLAKLYDAQWHGHLKFHGPEDCALVECLQPSKMLHNVTDAQLGMQDLERQKNRRLDQMILYAVGHRCREQILRHYFGEQVKEEELCGRCDVCAPKSEQKTELAATTQSAVADYLKQKETPALKGSFIDGGVALGYHSRVVNFQHEHTEIGERVYRFKYRNDVSQVEWLAAQALKVLRQCDFFANLDMMACVPGTQKDRAYEPVLLFSEKLAPALPLPFHQVLRKSKATRPQKEMATKEQKRRNVRNAFAANHPQAVAGRTVLLVDDLYDSGATIDECARILKQAGAKAVYVFALTKTGHVAK